MSFVLRVWSKHFLRGIVLPPATPSRVLRFAAHPYGTKPLTGPWLPERAPAYEVLPPMCVRRFFLDCDPLDRIIESVSEFRIRRVL